MPVGIAGWLPNDDAFLVYDEYDVWQIDPSVKSNSINITNSYGRKQHISFRLVKEKHASLVLPNETQLLFAFDSATKYNGFYKLDLGGQIDPKKLTMAPNSIYKSYYGSIFQANKGEIFEKLSSNASSGDRRA